MAYSPSSVSAHDERDELKSKKSTKAVITMVAVTEAELMAEERGSVRDMDARIQTVRRKTAVDGAR